MNQEKIGVFISKCRKDKNLTQEQLAEKLGVINKSISRLIIKSKKENIVLNIFKIL